jgi:Protein of unknown function (DUF1428)
MYDFPEERRRLLMAGYVDGFVMPLPKSNVDRYREIATTAGGLCELLPSHRQDLPEHVIDEALQMAPDPRTPRPFLPIVDFMVATGRWLVGRTPRP